MRLGIRNSNTTGSWFSDVVDQTFHVDTQAIAANAAIAVSGLPVVGPLIAEGVTLGQGNLSAGQVAQKQALADAQAKAIADQQLKLGQVISQIPAQNGAAPKSSAAPWLIAALPFLFSK